MLFWVGMGCLFFPHQGLVVPLLWERLPFSPPWRCTVFFMSEITINLRGASAPRFYFGQVFQGGMLGIHRMHSLRFTVVALRVDGCWALSASPGL